jgi:hypothetical protein
LRQPFGYYGTTIDNLTDAEAKTLKRDLNLEGDTLYVEYPQLPRLHCHCYHWHSKW